MSPTAQPRARTDSRRMDALDGPLRRPFWRYHQAVDQPKPKPSLDCPEPSAPDSLSELAQETLEQDEPEESPQNLVISSLAMLGAAVLIGLVGWWLLKGGFSEGTSGLVAHDKHGHPTGSSRILSGLVVGGVIAMFVAGVLALFA